MRDDIAKLDGTAEEALILAEVAEGHESGVAALDAAAHEDTEAVHPPKPDGESDPLGEAGWYLEHERVSHGLSLEDAGEATGIHPYHLEAIELGAVTHLPERSETLEMIGVYAQYLGFDPEPLVAHYAALLPPPPLAAEPRHPANPAPFSSARVLAFGRLAKLPRFNMKRMPRGGLVASVAGALILAAAAGYLLIPSTETAKPGTEVADSVPAGADPMPTASTGPEAADVAVSEAPMPVDEADATAAKAGENDLEGTGLDGITMLIEKNVINDTSKAKGKAKATAQPAAGDVPVNGEGRQFGNENGESRLTLKAKAPVWVRIEDSQGNVVMTQMLMKGDTYRVPNRDGLVVIARDGGLLVYVIDGKEKGILGTPGEILVGRSLDIKTFEG
jgi:cytoskeleton protein RodZ